MCCIEGAIASYYFAVMTLVVNYHHTALIAFEHITVVDKVVHVLCAVFVVPTKGPR